MIRQIAQAWNGSSLVNIIAITEGVALTENLSTGERTDVAYSTLTDVWPASETLENFDELQAAFTPEGVKGFIEVLTGSPEWADRVARVWSELY